MDDRKKTAISNEEACREGEATMEYKREMKEQQQQKKILEENDKVTDEDVEIRRLIEERSDTARGEKQHLKEVCKQI